MPIPFEINSPRDMLQKARRELEVLRAAVSAQDKQQIGDALYNFSVTAYHVKDWLIKQPGTSYTQKDVEDYIKNNQTLSICRDLSNGNKHKKITKYVPVTEETTASATSAVISLSMLRHVLSLAKPNRPFRVKIITTDGKRLEVVQVCEDAVRVWESFLGKYKL